jgi:hypothetical protein
LDLTVAGGEDVNDDGKKEGEGCEGAVYIHIE